MVNGLIPWSARRAGTPEMWETRVVWLITQRSRVQIPPPLPRCRSEAFSRTGKGPSAFTLCTELCTRPLRRAGPPWRLGGENVPRGRRSRRWRRTASTEALLPVHLRQIADGAQLAYY